MEFRGDKLRAIRLARKKTMKDLEDETGVKQTTISQMENGQIKNPRPDKVEPLAKALGIDDTFFYIEDAQLPTDILVSLPPDVRELLLSSDNLGYLVLGAKAKQSGIPLDLLNQLVDAFQKSAQLVKDQKDSETKDKGGARKSQVADERS